MILIRLNRTQYFHQHFCRDFSLFIIRPACCKPALHSTKKRVPKRGVLRGAQNSLNNCRNATIVHTLYVVEAVEPPSPVQLV
jgi:hypothetical protein